MPRKPIFDQMAEILNRQGSQALLDQLADHLNSERRYHELFEARKLQLRDRLGLPLIANPNDDVSAEIRDRLDLGLLEACREVGLLLLNDGRIRDGWHYLRALGDVEQVRTALASLQPNDDNLDEFLELCVHEGLDIERGFRLMLDRYGTCNSITAFESAMYGRSNRDRSVAAGLLVEHLYEELKANVAAHIQRQEPSAPPIATLHEALEGHPWLVADGAYHIDTTHLASVVRFALDVDDPLHLAHAVELAEYGQRLDTSLQYPGEPPFEALYPTSLRYFHALLGNDRQNHLNYFRTRAQESRPREETTRAIEVYIQLLARVEEPRLALDEALRLLPEGVQSTGLAPSLLELAQQADEFMQLRDLAEQRDDVLGYCLCLLANGNSQS